MGHEHKHTGHDGFGVWSSLSSYLPGLAWPQNEVITKSTGYQEEAFNFTVNGFRGSTSKGSAIKSHRKKVQSIHNICMEAARK